MENKNQPAYPFNEFVNEGNKHRLGLTKREYFAAMAMQGFLASYSGAMADPKPEHIAKEAIEYADELLKQLENGK